MLASSVAVVTLSYSCWYHGPSCPSNNEVSILSAIIISLERMTSHDDHVTHTTGCTLVNIDGQVEDRPRLPGLMKLACEERGGSEWEREREREGEGE